MPDRIIIMLIVVSVLGFIAFMGVLFCCVYISNSNNKDEDLEQERELKRMRRGKKS